MDANKKRPVGRPRSRRIKRHIKLLPEIDVLITQRAKQLGITKGEYIEDLVLRNGPKA